MSMIRVETSKRTYEVEAGTQVIWDDDEEVIRIEVVEA